MREDYLDVELFRLNNGALVRVHRQSNNMSDLSSNFGGIEATHGKDTACNRVCIPFWEVCATDNNIGQEEPWIWIVLPRVCELVPHERCIYPGWLNDWYQGIAGGVVLGKVERGRYYVSDALELKGIVFVAVKESRPTV